jgi:hypothetical protein
VKKQPKKQFISFSRAKAKTESAEKGYTMARSLKSLHLPGKKSAFQKL